MSFESFDPDYSSIALARQCYERRIAAYEGFKSASSQTGLPKAGSHGEGWLAALKDVLVFIPTPGIAIIQQAEKVLSDAIIAQARAGLNVAQTMANIPRSAPALALFTAASVHLTGRSKEAAARDFAIRGGIQDENEHMHRLGLPQSPALRPWADDVLQTAKGRLGVTVMRLNEERLSR